MLWGAPFGRTDAGLLGSFWKGAGQRCKMLFKKIEFLFRRDVSVEEDFCIGWRVVAVVVGQKVFVGEFDDLVGIATRVFGEWKFRKEP